MKLTDYFLPYCDHEYGNREDNAENCVEVAEDFAIGFSMWLLLNQDYEIDFEEKDPNEVMKQLLEIYKKEKGL